MIDSAEARIFSIEVERLPDQVALVRCHGRLVNESTEILSAGAQPLFPDCRRVLLDLTDLRHINSKGVGALVSLHFAAKSAGSSLELVNLSQHVRYVLGVTRLLGFFTVAGENPGNPM